MQTRTIDPKLRTIFQELNDDVLLLSWKWQIVTRLFESKERVGVINRTAPNFFLACRSTFTDDVFLALSRITDPRRTGSQENLVISCLVENLDPEQHPALFGQLSTLVAVSHKACRPIREHRNKRLGHNDFQTKLKYSGEPLPGIKIAQVNKAISSLQETLNTFSRYFFDKETRFEIVERGGVKALFTYLEKGLQAFDKENNAVRTALTKQ